MFLEESIEILNTAVAKERGDGADLGGREDAEQVSSEGQPDLDLKLSHRLAVFGKESPLECSHLNPDLSRKRAEPQLRVSVGSKNEMMRKLFRAFEECDMKGVTR